MQKSVSQLGLVLVCGLLLGLSACSGMKKNMGKGGPKPQPPKQEIAYLTFSLPEQVQWQRNPDESGMIEWVLAGYDPIESPARVMYQKMEPAQSVVAVKEQILQPLQECLDSQVSGFRGVSRYRVQLNSKAICSQLGQENFGLISFISIFGDQTANHLVIAEVRTPASTRAGALIFQNSEAQKQAEASKILSELLENLMQTIRVCDEQDVCI